MCRAAADPQRVVPGHDANLRPRGPCCQRPGHLYMLVFFAQLILGLKKPPAPSLSPPSSCHMGADSSSGGDIIVCERDPLRRALQGTRWLLCNISYLFFPFVTLQPQHRFILSMSLAYKYLIFCDQPFLFRALEGRQLAGNGERVC